MSSSPPGGSNASSPSASTAGGMAIRGLTVKVPGRVLLEDADADFPENRITLVIGASGAGKTVLLKILAGLLGPDEKSFEIRGSVRFRDAELLGGDNPGWNSGIVFQNFALFDEFSSHSNIRFAADHRRRRGTNDADLEPQALLDEFQVPSRTPVRALSGGQQQRLAIARTLAYDPDVLIYDEPTSGLDPANAAKVATRIRHTGESRGKTTIVVTHDYEHLAGIADAIYMLDPDTRQLRRLAASDLEDVTDGMPVARAFEEEPPERPTTAIEKLAGGVARFLETTGAAVERALMTAAYLLPIWRSPRWGLRYFLHYLQLVASFSAWLYFACAGLIAGFVATYFSFHFLPHRNYSEPLIGDEILSGLGFVVYRTVVPVLITVLLAARCGAAVASDVGNRSYTHQLDAMRSFGAHPRRYLLTNILFAFLVATPILVGIGFLAARYTSLVVFAYNHPDKGPEFWDGNFHRDLRVPGWLFYRGSGWLLAKVLVCGLGVGSVAYHIAERAKFSGVEVSRGITHTIIWATLYVLAVHFGFAFFEF